MRGAHSVAAVRAAEDVLHAQLPAGALMQRAAAGLATACAGRLGRVYGSRVAVLAGRGGNGGDALYAGARLAARGALVEALLLGDPMPDALAAFRRAGGRVVSRLRPAEVALDGIVGIGGRGGLRAEAADAVGAVTAPLVAVDVPSGVDADTGAVEGPAVRAAATVTFGTLKPGLLVGLGRQHAGEVELVDIGLGPHLPEPELEALEAADVAALLPTAVPGDDKYTRGVVGVVAGSARYPGAAVLAVTAAARAGAGMIRFVGDEDVAERVRAARPEAVVTAVQPGDGEAVLAAGRVQAWVVGPGMGTGPEAEEVVEAVLGTDVPVLVDADAITVCSRHPEWLQRRGAPTLLTPHDREAARFGSEVGADRIGAARRLARELGAVVLLKGDATIVAEPDGRVRVNATGSPVLATAGTGDVLSGAAGALLAGGLCPLDAGSVAAWLHGNAARLASAGAPVPALDVAEAWPRAVRGVRR